MMIRRLLHDSGTSLTYQVSDDGTSWAPAGAGARSPLGYTAPFRPEWEVERARDAGVEPGDAALPFEPVSFRDFMLYRGHYTGAARGWTRRFRPHLARVTTAVETVTRRTFPGFTPPRLWDTQPIYYMSNARTFVPSGTPVAAPTYTRALDWELELGFVLKEPLLDATPEEAEAAIGAFVVLNDLSARDVQIPEQDSGFGPQKAKHFASSLSATAVCAQDVLARWTDLVASVHVNDQLVARPDASTPRWSLGQVLAHASSSEQLVPGELFGTGTLVAGSGMETGTWLRPGDELRLCIEGIGTIEHTIAGG